MVAVPALTPVTIPVPAPTVAFVIVLLVHVPPAGDEPSVVVLPIQVVNVPVMLPGVAITVTTLVDEHPKRM